MAAEDACCAGLGVWWAALFGQDGGDAGAASLVEAEEPPAPEPAPETPAEEVKEVRLCVMGCGCQVPRDQDCCCRTCALSPGSGVHDTACLGPPRGGQLLCCAQTGETDWRPICPKGARCKQRVPEHLLEQAHPLDQDYCRSCKLADIAAEEKSLKLLFDWADVDASGKLSKTELSAMLHIIHMLGKTRGCSQEPDDVGVEEISGAAWEKLDEDGNGLVNFHEFACWAGPRLGLPLGVRKMVHRSASMSLACKPCSVFNCPCEDFVESGWLGWFSLCGCCKHKKSLHKTVAPPDGEIIYPDYWRNRSGQPHQLVSVTGVAADEFQRLLQCTYRNRWTRDRARHNPQNKNVPSGFRVVDVQRNENCENWREYCVRRAELMMRIDESKQEGDASPPLELIEDVLTTVAWSDIAGAKANRLVPMCNEWYLFHGTSPEAAQTICSTDFKLSYAGDNTGTLYGRGLYFAESVTKADEYAKPNADGTYAVLLCRVLGGRVQYTDEVTPDVESLVRGITEGPYDSILGDRVKCRGTYREFVIFDTEDVYPEYVIKYRRQY